MQPTGFAWRKSMQPIPFNMKGTEYAIKSLKLPPTRKATSLSNFIKRIRAVDILDTLTTNLVVCGPKDCGFVNTKATGKRFYAWIKRNGLENQQAKFA